MSNFEELNRQHERSLNLFNEIADFELQLNDYDDQLNNIIFDSVASKTTDTKPQTTPDSKIQSMLKEIDNEFDELDNLLRDIDTLKLQDEPGNEERISNSSYEMEIKSRPKAKQLAPN